MTCATVTSHLGVIKAGDCRIVTLGGDFSSLPSRSAGHAVEVARADPCPRGFLNYSDAQRSAVESAYPRTDRVEDVILTFYDSIKHKPETPFGNAKADVAIEDLHAGIKIDTSAPVPASVTSVEMAVGFSETSLFSTAFRKATAMIPRGFQRSA